MKTEQLSHAIHVIGIELQTTNLEAMQTIPPHWQRFGKEEVLAHIATKLNGDVYAVYTHFENAGVNNTGLYSLVIGAAVPANAEVPVGMLRVVIPASKRAVFDVAPGRFDLVGAKWVEIWGHAALTKTFIAEYEQYSADGKIAISMGLQ